MRRTVREPPQKKRFIVSDSESDSESETETETEFKSEFKSKFKSNTSESERKWLKTEEQRLHTQVGADIPMKHRILMLPCPDEVKIKALTLLKSYEDDPENNSSALNALQLIARLPWNIYHKFPVTIQDSYQKVQEFLKESYTIMDREVYGHASAKSEIMEYLVSIIANPSSSRIIGLMGPPGIGKTSLIMNGCSRALGFLPMYTVPLGGSKDVGFITGSLPVWKGSHQGILVDALIETGCMNPIIYFDEIDKICAEHNLDIQAKLIHLTDTTCNHRIMDNFLGINLDLSKVTFVLTYNDPNAIHPALLDRIQGIRLSGFTPQDKMVIMKDYVTPKIMRNMFLTQDHVVLTDDIIEYINSKIETYATNTEVASIEGVRHLFKGYQKVLSRILLNFFVDEDLFQAFARSVLGLQCEHKTKNYRKEKQGTRTLTPSWMSCRTQMTLPYTPTKSDIDIFLR